MVEKGKTLWHEPLKLWCKKLFCWFWFFFCSFFPSLYLSSRYLFILCMSLTPFPSLFHQEKFNSYLAHFPGSRKLLLSTFCLSVCLFKTITFFNATPVTVIYLFQKLTVIFKNLKFKFWTMLFWKFSIR